MLPISGNALRKYLPQMEPVCPPVLYNGWKHHLGFLQAVLLMAREQGEEMIDQNINKIGDNVMDLYIGQLTPLQVSAALVAALKTIGIVDFDSYRVWLTQQGHGYGNLQITDQSKWTLLLGKGEMYIHIHPARYSPHSVRVKGQTLKSAIWISYEILKANDITLHLDFINLIRKERLRLSPIKSLSLSSSLVNLIHLMLNFKD